jgi:DNA-binding NarL/FixJ family response regulator
MSSLLELRSSQNGAGSTVRNRYPARVGGSGERLIVSREWRGDGAPSDPSSAAGKNTSVAIQVLVADPHDLFRMGLTLHLAGQDDLCALEGMSDNREALSACRSRRVDVLVCAHDCAGLPIRQLIAEVRSVSPDTRVLVLSGDAAPPEEDMLRAGAWGVVSRRLTADDFARSIRAVAAGQMWASRELLCRLAQMELSDLPKAAVKKARPFLSAREIEILELVAADLTNDSIAERLFVESSTIRTHLRRIFRKLKVHDRRSAANVAAALGLIASSVSATHAAGSNSAVAFT